MSKLSAEQVSVYLRKLPKWKYDDDHSVLVKTYELNSFGDAIRFVNQIAELADAANHHPDISIRYKKVSLALTTHSNKGVTGKDFLLAQQIERITL